MGGILLVGSLVYVVDGVGQFRTAPARSLPTVSLLYSKRVVTLHETPVV